MAVLTRYKKPGGFASLAYLIESLGSEKRQRYLEIIEGEDPNWASLLKGKLLTMERILNFPEKSLRDITSQLPIDFFPVMFHAVTTEQFEFMTSTLPKGRVRTIVDLAQTIQPSAKEIETTFLSIIRKVRSLEEDGVLKIAKIDPSLELLDPPKSVPWKQNNLAGNSVPGKSRLREEKWILIIDDEDEIRQTLRKTIYHTFTTFQPRIIEAHDGLDAKIKLEERMFDCIVTDLQMPRMGGEGFIESCQSNILNANTPLIIFTGFPDRDLEKKFAHVRVLEKPMPYSELAELLEDELRVGRTDKRIPAFLLNPVIEGTIMYLEQTVGIDKPSRKTPLIKKAGQKPSSDILVTLQLQAGSVQNSITLGYNNGLIKYFIENSDHFKNLQEQKKEHVAWTVSQGIFEETEKIFNKQFVHSLSLLSIVVSASNQEEFKQVASGGGIIIPISISDKQLLIKAISRPSVNLKMGKGKEKENENIRH